jgi:hypothetical protein
MEPATGAVVRLSTSLIHFYLVAPPSPLWAGSAAQSEHSPDEHAVRPSRLLQRWNRNPGGALTPCWEVTGRDAVGGGLN